MSEYFLSALRPALAAGMRGALDAAEKFIGATAPNPPVGAAILAEDGTLLSVGAHEKAGHPHAEVNAYRALKDSTRAHTILVTLEPCDHQGRTGPCTEFILQTPIRHVIFAIRDPARGGAQKLRAAGLRVEQLDPMHPFAQEAYRQLTPFLTVTSTKKPWVIVKTAHQVDSWAEGIPPITGLEDFRRTMLPDAGQKTFTQPESLTLAHRMRKHSDAILTGAGTIQADAPLFNVRHVPDHPGKERLLLLAEGTRKASEEWKKQAMTRGFKIQVFNPTTLNMEALLQELGSKGILQLLVEAGPKLSHWILSSCFWDEHVLILHKRGAALSFQGTENEDADRVTHVYRNR